MSSHALALPRHRRLRRPPGRLLYYLITGLATASILCHAVFRMFDGHFKIWEPFIAALWGFQMALSHASVRWTWNAWLEGWPSIPVRRWEWGLLGLYVAYAIYVWFDPFHLA